MDERPPMERAMSTDVVSTGHCYDVMSQLKVRDLLNCRKVSKFWNKTASAVLRKRSTMIKKISTTKSLMQLEKCMNQNSDFPFAGLKFTKPWKLTSARAMAFFKTHGARFTSLYLEIMCKIKLEQEAPLINHLPRLSILELMCWPASDLPSELLDSAAEQEEDQILDLPSLRVLRIPFKLNEDIIRQVCMAASPSLRIECLDAGHEILETLESAGKLQAVSVLTVLQPEDEEDYGVRVDQLLTTQTPTLTKLEFEVRGCISRNGLIELLISSQHSLKELRLVGMYPSEFSSECPVLPKLTTLSLYILDQPCGYIFQGSHGQKFPALKELKLDSSYNFSVANFSDGFFIVPSLTTIYFECYVDKDGMENLARCFPNVIDIRLQHYMFDFERSWDSDPTHIWSVGAFKHLEKLLIWDYTVQSPTKMNMNMDSFLTGIPINICENLRQQAQQNVTDSPFNEISRESPSILQLKNLKELTICVKLQGSLKELPEEPPFISMVSVRYALMMPELKTRFVYEHGSPSWHFKEKRDKAVAILKGAFKHVQPYVTLEPFYY